MANNVDGFEETENDCKPYTGPTLLPWNTPWNKVVWGTAIEIGGVSKSSVKEKPHHLNSAEHACSDRCQDAKALDGKGGARAVGSAVIVLFSIHQGYHEWCTALLGDIDHQVLVQGHLNGTAVQNAT